MRKFIILFILLYCAISISGVSAQEKGKEIPKKVYKAKRVNPHPPVIDGLIKDEVWAKAEWSGDFRQMRPYDGEKPSQETAFKIVYDDNNLYVFIRAYDTEPDKIEKRMGRRDEFPGDMVEINIDSHFDKQTAYSFTVSASGVIGDEAITDNGNNWDGSWDPIWFVKTHIDDQGWTAEMRIPFSQLRFGNKEEQVWGLQFMRHIFRKEERSNWQYIPQDSPGMVHLFGELHGLNGIKPRRQVELLPYTVGNTQRFKKIEGNPYKTGSISDLAGGLDGKIGLTNDITMDFSINPDFGQVEADPSVVNLTAYETFFQEKRPFFVGGRSIYEFRAQNGMLGTRISRDNLFYSRRIGRAPHHYPNLSDNEYADIPERTSILGAVKISGKTKNGLSIGLIESVTSEEKAEIDNLGQKSKETVEPMTNYFVGRVQKDFDKGNTVLGGMITAVNRNIDNPAMNYLHKAAYTGGFDFLHNFKKRTYYVGLKGLFSSVSGDKESIQATQLSSARYYQRPDADHVSYDENLTSLSGHAGTVKFGKRGSGKIRFETGFSYRSPGFELNDIGYNRYSDVLHQWNWMGYWVNKPFSIFHNFSLNMNYWMYWDYAGNMLSKHQNVNFHTQFKNYWSLNGDIGHDGETISPTALRGGPSFTQPGLLGGSLMCFTDRRKKIRFNFGGYNYKGSDNSAEVKGMDFGVSLQPTNALNISVRPSFGFTKDKLQFVGIENMGNDTRYIFAEIDQKTTSFTIRMNYNLTPTLTIQYYGMPFISAGRYSSIKRITDPRGANFHDRYHSFDDKEMISKNNTYYVDENGDGNTDYSISNPDFNFKQFRSNLIVRWEYSPGSTLFFVWTQGRTGYAQDGNYSFRNNMDDLFSVYPHNVFLIKFNRWFSL